MALSGSSTIIEAKAWLRARLAAGERCPVCDQTARVYRRHITKPMANALVAMYRAGGCDWVHLPTVVGPKRADEAKLVYWGLIEEDLAVRPDGGRAGWWRVTPDGKAFLQGAHRVRRTAVIYNSRLLELDDELIGINDCLDNFDLQALLDDSLTAGAPA